MLRFRLLECLVICFHARTANDIEGEMEMEKWWRRRTHSLSRLRDFGHCACQERKGHYVEGGWMSEDGRFFPRLGCNCSACRVCVPHPMQVRRWARQSEIPRREKRTGQAQADGSWAQA